MQKKNDIETIKRWLSKADKNSPLYDRIISMIRDLLD